MLTAVASPLINSALFGMPAADTLPPILFKSSLLAVAAGLTAARCRRVSLPLLAAVVLGYQAIGTLGEWAMTGSLRAALQDFRIGLPGMSEAGPSCAGYSADKPGAAFGRSVFFGRI